MLELKEITKIYPAGGEDVAALKGIDLRFRKSEFVSILGPSGCGKTTMLNIIGGLDGYTSGDLVINGVSTKEYKARDWDAYRNHSIGFVFQSYNLIPHQTVLSNVELALTLSGVPKKERRERAKEALCKVGLQDQMKKRPSEMSGGQMQRVAIARAIVNNPDIILADEPTGALDTETSVQVMEILKEIAKDRLVIMVTHNPDLAEKYSTRVVKMLDGKIIGDSMPVSEEEIPTETAEKTERATGKVKKPSMSFATSFGLSLRNLFTKKGRTILTAFAGSIGIIGIALIYAVSQGTTLFIDSVQEDTLSSYPLTIQAQSMDMSSLLTTFMGKAESIGEHENDGIYQKAMVYEMMNSLNSMEVQENDLKSFKEYIETEKQKEGSPLNTALSAVQYSYNTDLLIYTKNVDGEIIRSDSQRLMASLIKEYMGMDFSTMASLSNNSMFGDSTQLMTQSTALWKELIPEKTGEPVSNLTKKQYSLLEGRWPEDYNEIVLFVDEKNELDDMTLYALGLLSEEEIDRLMEAAINEEVVEYDVRKWEYSDILGMDFRTILNSDCYRYDEETGTYKDLRETETGLKYLYDNATVLKVVGIAKPEETAVSTSRKGSIGYTYKLVEYIIEEAEFSEAVKAQKESPDTDVFTGLHFRPENGKMSESEKAEKFREHVETLSDMEKVKTFVAMKSIVSDEEVDAYVKGTLDPLDRAAIESMALQSMESQTAMDPETVKSYLEAMEEDELRDMIAGGMEKQYREQYAQQVQMQLANVPAPQLLLMMDREIKDADDALLAGYYDQVLEFSESDYEENLIKLGSVDLAAPSAINLYATTFENKDTIEEAISEYNRSVDDLKEIQYTDYVGIIMSCVTTIIDAITYVLIAFVAVSLIVSSIMIGVITLISVQERTKEIGILRAIGASKRNVSSMFNAETVLIGFAAGVLGILVTYLLCIPINLILQKLTGLENLKAVLPLPVAVVLILISMFLTLIAGIIPSRSAAKKDPVVALRTE